MKKPYRIFINGRALRFATLDEARAKAAQIQQLTGIIVGIEGPN